MPGEAGMSTYGGEVSETHGSGARDQASGDALRPREDDADPLRTLMLDRLADTALSADVTDLLIAGLDGTDPGDTEPRTAELGGTEASGTEQGTTAPGPGLCSVGSDLADGHRPPRAYLRSITVEGFRGIGRRQELTLHPGPGLTLIVGRNGSGKSSFAEALEFALTGDSHRWKNRPTRWRDGWRNLHSPDPCSIRVGLALDSVPGTTEVVRSWEPGAELARSDSFVQYSGVRHPLAGLGWAPALDLYRPFLSYTELGALLNAKQTELHDSIQNLLGLDRLVRLEADLLALRKHLQTRVRHAAEGRARLQAALSRSADPRAAHAKSLLAADEPDLRALADLAGGDVDDTGPVLPWLRRLAGLAVPSAVEVRQRLSELRDALAGFHSLAHGTAETAHRRARLLQTALHYHEHLRTHGQRPQHEPPDAAPCPVCGQGRLDERWHDAATEELSRLREEAREIERAEARIVRARRAVRELVTPPPALLEAAPGPGPAGRTDPAVSKAARSSAGAPDTAAGDTAAGDAAAGDAAAGDAAAGDAAPAGLPELRARWTYWSTAPDDDAALIAHLESAHEPLVRAAETVRAQAAAMLQAADDAWRPLARSLAAWTERAQDAAEAEARLRTVRQGLDWLRRQAQALRDERLAPFAERSRAIWQELRQQSNIELGALRLDGQGNRRQLRLDVAVDEVDTGGLGVMSQGELHALGLALFLPRATAAESPFRFVVIDDPVQAMDPWKVDGLAKVLVESAHAHQVVVFTHDDRLPEALRRMQLPATIIEVVRRENSELELRQVRDPVQLYLDDARAIAKTRRLSTETRGPVVAGLCRSALEAACHRTIRRTELAKGTSHAEVEERIAKATTLSQIVALCLFGDPGRTADVADALAGPDGRGREAFRICDRALHGLVEVKDPQQLIGVVRRLVKRIEAL